MIIVPQHITMAQEHCIEEYWGIKPSHVCGQTKEA